MNDATRHRRPHWRARLAKGLPKGYPSKLPEKSGRGFKIGPRCTAIARSTGLPCGNLRMIGAKTCNKHGGHLQAYRSEIARLGPGKVFSLVRGRAAIRKALRDIGMNEPLPPGMPWIVSSLERGIILEAFKNREQAPEEWHKLANKHGYKP